ncbi:MAG: hypothetical protein ACI9GW_000795 [Halieaceae bacterium]|jgi:hypothetical protein
MVLKHGNPQGKGLIPVLESLEALRQLPARDRSSQEWLLDYLAGALVVSAKFSFRPLPNRAYYLYWCEGEWSLSIISPAEWGDRLHTSPVAQCTLRDDYSWKLSPHEAVAHNPDLLTALATFQAGFMTFIDTPIPLVDNLPFCQAELPWYPRVMALGLSKSLKVSMDRAGTGNQTGQALLQQVSYTKNLLLEQNPVPGRL